MSFDKTRLRFDAISPSSAASVCWLHKFIFITELVISLFENSERT
jgi:hypothetical protein